MTRRGEVRACGYIWKPWDDGVATHVHDRFLVTTWGFGSINKSKVFVTYPKSRDPMARDKIGICLAPGKTREEAMQRGISWVEKYRNSGGPESPEKLFPKLFRDWRIIYRNRLDILGHLFFTNGNGYSWLDGAVVANSDGKPRKSRRLPKGAPKWLSPEFFALKDYRLQDRIQRAHFDREEAKMEIGPLPDDGKPRHFYPICQYSLILCIPDDVRPDWLKVAYEAALCLRDRQDPSPPKYSLEDTTRPLENIKHGKRIVAELEAKYPYLKPSA